jgi:23S rRNA (adenine2503-C2)-methyltransferase
MNAPRPEPAPGLLDLEPAEARARLEAWLATRGEKPFRARQVLEQLYGARRSDPRAMTALPAALREDLAAELLPAPLADDLLQVSADGTRKYRFRLADGSAIEAVWIPSGERGTLCVSSQVGCAAACTFCATGTLGLMRNLRPSEILGQWLRVDRDLRERSLGTVTQIVFMGMGEPLHNWPNVATALSTLTAAEGFAFSPRRVTVSTVGIAPKIPELAARFPQVRIALSLHSAREETRSAIVPVTRRHSLAEVARALRSVVAETRRLSVEYVVLPGINDAREEALALARFARELGAHVNLLPFHPFEGALYRPTPPATIQRFAEWVRERHPGAVTIRRSRGLDIAGACGQLALRDAPPAGSPSALPVEDPEDE